MKKVTLLLLLFTLSFQALSFQSFAADDLARLRLQSIAEGDRSGRHLLGSFSMGAGGIMLIPAFSGSNTLGYLGLSAGFFGMGWYLNNHVKYPGEREYTDILLLPEDSQEAASEAALHRLADNGFRDRMIMGTGILASAALIAALKPEGDYTVFIATDTIWGLCTLLFPGHYETEYKRYKKDKEAVPVTPTTNVTPNIN